MFFHFILIPILATLLFLIIYMLSVSLYDTKISLVQKFSLHPSKLLITLSGKLNPQIRNITYLICLLWALGLIAHAYFSDPTKVDFPVNIVRGFGLSSYFLLFIVLTPGLLSVYFPTFTLNSLLTTSRRAWGVSLFIFVFIHALVAFFIYYHGSFLTFNTLSSEYKLAVLLGLISLFIFFLLFMTSNSFFVRKLTFKKWKVLHRFVYIAIVFAILHAFIRGSHFNNPNEIPFIFFMIFLSLLFLLLEAGATLLVIFRTERYSLLKKITILPILILLIFGAFYLSFQKMAFLTGLTNG